MGNITCTGSIDYSDLVYSSNEEDIKKYKLEKDDLLFNRTNSSEWVGKTAIFKIEEPTIYAGYLIRVRCILVDPDYINFVMNSSYHREWCNQVKTDAVNQSNINAQKLSNFSIPIPPLYEQHRIVAEIERWFTLIDLIEQDKADLQTTIKQAKSKILDLAIHGKLVPQDSNDEPASELLKRINPNAKITCDNGQYGKMPNGWIISSYKNIVKNISSKPFQILQSEIKDKGLYPVISQSCNYIEGFTDSAEKLFQSQESIIFGDHTRNVKYLNFPFVVGADGVKILQTEACCKYIYYFTIFAANNFIQDKGYSRHYGQLSSISVAIPPLAEQHRIVAKIEELFTSLDNIQKALEV
jgi:type I restriction enzyme S subunit